MEAEVMVDVAYEGNEDKSIVREEFWKFMSTSFEGHMDLPDDLQSGSRIQIVECLNLPVYSISNCAEKPLTVKRKARHRAEDVSPSSVLVRFCVSVYEWSTYIQICRQMDEAGFEVWTLDEGDEFWTW